MTRKDFIKNMGLGAAFVLTMPCLHSCSSDDDENTPPPSADKDFTVDLNAPENVGLTSPGGFVIREKVVVAQTLDGEYVAASLVCSHEAFEVMHYDADDDRWFCSTHGAIFETETGDPLNSVTSNPLTIYNVSQNGDLLRIQS